MVNKKTFLAILPCLIVIFVHGQNYDYTLSDDSLVNYHASIKRIYYATRTQLKPKIDGKLNDACWQKDGIWDGGFIQQQPNQGRQPSQETEIKILYDDNNLYIAIKCHDNEPEKIKPILGRRDVFVGDMAGISIDSYFDKRTAFEFNVTAAGQKLDLMHYGSFGLDLTWDAVWDGKATISDSAWYGEMRVSFSQLRYANKEEHVWGMNVWRWIYRLKEQDEWKLVPLDAPSTVYIFGELRGIKDIPYKRNFEVIPYTKAKYVSDAEQGVKFGFGVDGKIGLTSDLTLDYTINPDFGQVEADPSILNLTSYEIFYDEKRPFFLEGNKILEYTSEQDLLFYSRRIGHAPSYKPKITEKETVSSPDQTSILNALKLSGKNKSGFSIGVINSITSREKAIIFFDGTKRREVVEPFTNYFIGRVKQDFNSGNTVLGAIVTSTIRNIKNEQLEFLPDNSLVGGIDFLHNWMNRKYFIDLKSFFSKINGSTTAISSLQTNSRHYFQREDASHLEFNPELTSLQGWGGEISGGKRSGSLRLVGKLDWRSPGVELNDVGYLHQADYVKEEISLNYRVSKPKGILMDYRFDIEQQHLWSFGGENLGDNLNIITLLRFKNLWRFDMALNRTFNELDTRQLRGGPALWIGGNTATDFSAQTNYSKNLVFGAGANFARYDDKISKGQGFNFSAKWLINNRLNITWRTNFINRSDNNQYLMQPMVNDSKVYVVGKIDRQTVNSILRVEFFVTPELSFQYYGSPYASTGNFLDYRKVEQSRSRDLEERFSLLSIVENEYGQKHLLDNNDNLILNLSNSNPDFNFQEFRSNFVARWEYKTGSSLYFVWTNNRSRIENKSESSILNSFKGISKVAAQNAFMIKISFWFSI